MCERLEGSCRQPYRQSEREREGRVSREGEIPEDYQLLDLHQEVGVGYDMLQYLYIYEHTWKYIRDTGW